MKEKIKKSRQTVSNLKNATILITFVSLAFSTYTIFERYDQLKSDFNSSVKQKLYDEYFCCDYWGDVSNEIDERANENHINDVVDEHIIDQWIKRNLSEMGTMDTSTYNYYWKNTDRSLVKEQIINYRIKKEQDIEHEKQRLKEDSIFNVRFAKIEKEAEIQTAQENIFARLPIAYLFGALLGTSILPLIFWFLYNWKKSQLTKLIEEDLNNKKEQILSHSKLRLEFQSKYISLEDLERSKIITNDQFNQKRIQLIKEYYKTILEEQKMADRAELEIKLKTALELGTITQEEYDIKLGRFRFSEKSQE
jgi:hypothetical protein